MLADGIYPQSFSSTRRSAGAEHYLNNPSTRKLAEFFEAKGLPALKDEDRREQWYDDWLAYQAAHQLYASLLSPAQYSTLGFQFDLLAYSRFLEVFAWFSPAHGYSLQVTFLGLFSILMGTNDALKREAVQALEQGGLLALGVSEQEHGSDLLANEFTISQSADGRLLANGRKYYIGNSNAAAIISIMADVKDARRTGPAKRPHPALLALRPGQSPGFRSVKKIRTLGVRSAFVGEFEVKDQPVLESDLIAQGREAWDAVFGTITLGKFFLGFGSIGICEHALEEAAAHLSRRILYGESVIEMPHIRFAMAQAWARLTAMKLYANRALDYVQASSTIERRYILYCAVQKAKVSTEGVKVMAQLLECIGARGFESDTYFEMALRDVQLIPSLEGSTHVNLRLTAQFIGQYFAGIDSEIPNPPSLAAAGETSPENPYLMQARASALHTIAFPHFLGAYRPLISIPNVRLFAKQARAFQSFMRKQQQPRGTAPDPQVDLFLGQCLATIAYGQLIAENAVGFDVPAPIVSTIFHFLVSDLGGVVMALAASGRFDSAHARKLIRRVGVIPQTAKSDWDFVAGRVASA